MRVLRLPSLAEDLDEVLIPRDHDGPLSFLPPAPARPTLPENRICPDCGRLLLASEAALWGHRHACPYRTRRAARGPL